MSVETVNVQRGNKFLRIPADAVDRYIAKGYDVVDDNDRVIVKSIPNDVNTLKAEYSKQLELIKKLEAENAELKKQLASKPASKPVIKPVVEEVNNTESVEETVATKKRSKKN